MNVGSGHYFEERDTGIRNANETTPMDLTNPTDNDRAQCWDLVSNRVGDFDIVTVDDDVLKRLLPYSHPDDAAEFGHRIVKRAPGRKKKGRSKDAHKPQNPRLLQDVTPTILSIYQHVVDEWEDDRIQSNAQAGTRVSTTRTEVQERWGIQIPSALRPGPDRPGWIRIDIQGTYQATPGQRVANIQGHWGNNSVFHVIVPVGVTIGCVVIRAAMHESLRTHTSVIIAASNSRPSSGGTKPGTTPPLPSGPSGGKGNGWIYVAAALIPIGVRQAMSSDIDLDGLEGDGSLYPGFAQEAGTPGSCTLNGEDSNAPPRFGHARLVEEFPRMVERLLCR